MVILTQRWPAGRVEVPRGLACVAVMFMGEDHASAECSVMCGDEIKSDMVSGSEQGVGGGPESLFTLLTSRKTFYFLVLS